MYTLTGISTVISINCFKMHSLLTVSADRTIITVIRLIQILEGFVFFKFLSYFVWFSRSSFCIYSFLTVCDNSVMTYHDKSGFVNFEMF